MSDARLISVPKTQKLKAARNKVLETSELLELALTFLPPENIFNLLRVSKYWNNVITNSVELQQKMFLRLRNRPPELWTLDARHNPGANNYPCARLQRLNDTETKFRRVKSFSKTDLRAIRPLTLNPMLRSSSTDFNSARAFLYPSIDLNLTCSCWVDVLPHDESLYKTYFADPPCQLIQVSSINLFFGHYDEDSETWTPVHVPDAVEELLTDDPCPNNIIIEGESIRARVATDGSNMIRNPDGALTFGDMLNSAFDMDGHTYRSHPRRTDHGTMNKVVRDIKRCLGVKSMPRRAYMIMFLTAYGRRAEPQMILPTDEERAQANADWGLMQPDWATSNGQ